MSRPWTRIGAMATITGLLLAACSGGGGGNKGGSARASGKCPLGAIAKAPSKPVNQTGYDDTFTKFKAGLGSGDLPDLVQLQDTSLQLMIDSRAVLPAQACVDAEKYDLSDHIARVIDYYTVKNVLWPMPFNVSNLVLLYNKQAFTRAGLDPEKAPGTFDEVRAASEKIVASGAAKVGLAL